MILKNESKPRVLAPTGAYPAVCVDVVQRGWENTNFGERERIQFVFQTPHTNAEYDEPLTISSRPFNITFGKRSSLRAFLESWRGGKYTDAQAKEGVDTEKCIGRPCLITVAHNEHEGTMYANIEGIMPIMDGVVAPTPWDGYERVKDRDGGWDVRSPNSKAIKNEPAPPQVQNDMAQAAGEYPAGAQVNGDGTYTLTPDDDLPF